jgi:hypothetical protein
LNHPARSVGHPGIIADDHLNLPIGDDFAVLLHIELDACLELRPDGAETGAGHRHADPDLQSLLCEYGWRKYARSRRSRHALENRSPQHRCLHVSTGFVVLLREFLFA